MCGSVDDAMTRPTHSRDRRDAIPGDDASAVVKELVPGLVVRCAHARKESNLRSSVLETATSP
jgi:hypothetical protein